MQKKNHSHPGNPHVPGKKKSKGSQEYIKSKKHTHNQKPNQKPSPSPQLNSKESKGKFVEGILVITARGSGIVRSKEIEKSIEIDASKLNTGLHGDTVVASIKGPSRYPDSLVGGIEKVLRRSKVAHAGLLEKENGKTDSKNNEQGNWIMTGSDPRLYTKIRITEWSAGSTPNNVTPNETVVLVAITKWPDGGTSNNSATAKLPEGKVIKIAGKKGEPDTEEKVFALERGFDGHFPPAVEAEAQKIRENFKIEQTEKDRRDMRGIFTCTIDPKDAKDFDDAISFQTLPNGNMEIGVHIADVSYFVKPGTELDKEARERATSVYLVDRTIPMLPEVLSNDLCSLTPATDKCAMSAIVEMTPSFQIVNTWYGRTVIHSQKRFTYEEAFEVLEKGSAAQLSGGDNGSKYADILKTLNKIAKNLRNKRMNEGALSLESDEIKFTLDDFGFPTGIMRKVRNDAHKLVEEFMLLANALVAEELGENKAKELQGAMLYRIHDKPTLEKMEDLSAFMQSLGHVAALKKGIVPAQVLAKAIADTDDATVKEVMQTVIIRSQQKAIYSQDNKGHFGLALTYYTHFTSPIRRYPDVVIHRLLAEMADSQAGEKKVGSKEKKSFREIAAHSSMREVDAQEAERASDKYYQTLYMRDKVGQILSGTVTGLNDRGLFVRDDISYSEGFVRFKDQYNERFTFSKKNYTAVGEKTGVKFSLGDKVQVKVTDVRPDRREIDFSLIKAEAEQSEGNVKVK